MFVYLSINYLLFIICRFRRSASSQARVLSVILPNCHKALRYLMPKRKVERWNHLSSLSLHESVSDASAKLRKRAASRHAGQLWGSLNLSQDTYSEVQGRV